MRQHRSWAGSTSPRKKYFFSRRQKPAKGEKRIRRFIAWPRTRKDFFRITQTLFSRGKTKARSREPKRNQERKERKAPIYQLADTSSGYPNPKIEPALRQFLSFSTTEQTDIPSHKKSLSALFLSSLTLRQGQKLMESKGKAQHSMQWWSLDAPTKKLGQRGFLFYCFIVHYIALHQRHLHRLHRPRNCPWTVSNLFSGLIYRWHITMQRGGNIWTWLPEII